MRAADVVEEWATAWSNHDIDRILALYAEDCSYEDTAFGINRQGNLELRDFAGRFLGAFTDFRIDLIHHFTAEEWAVAESTVSGTHNGALADLPASGQRFSLRRATIFVLKQRKIVRSTHYWDRAAFLEQIGAFDAPEDPTV